MTSKPCWEPLPLGEHVLAESPRWDAANGLLSWVDCVAGTVSAASQADSGWTLEARHVVGSLVTAAVPKTDGGWWVAVGPGVATLSRAGEVGEPRWRVSADFPAVRTNDMVLDPVGRLLVGLFAEDRTSEVGGVVSVEPSTGRMRNLVTDMVTANGLGISPDRRSLYAVDTARGTLTRHPYHVDDGVAGEGEVVVSQSGGGRLDGLAVDPDGDLWVAVWDAGQVHRYSPDGHLLQVLYTPVARPSAVAVAGAAHDLLVVTTARSDLVLPDGHIAPSPDGRLYAYSIER